MERLKSEFLEQLSMLLGNHQEKKAILMEYDVHLDEILKELKEIQDESEVRNQIYSRFGTPEEITILWKEELSVTPSNMRWLFLLVNILLFTSGIALTLAHQLLDWRWITTLWQQITAIPIVIAMIYMVFWALLGYEIGRSFGYKGKKLLNKTFILAIIPNVSLMLLTVFRIIPHEWFRPLLTETFIVICIIFTFLLYPVCLISYQWGKKASI